MDNQEGSNIIVFKEGVIEFMVSASFSEGISETLDILNHMDKEYTDMIPEKFKEFLNKNKSTIYTPKLDHSKKINEMDLKEKTKDILATIYMNYWCNDIQKTDYKKLLNENEAKYQEEIREKYNPDNMFKKHSQATTSKENIMEENVTIIEYKDSIFKCLIKKIKNIFHMN